jgi:hypothetical protein
VAIILGSSIPLTFLAVVVTIITVILVAVYKYHTKCKLHYDRAELIEEGEGWEEGEAEADEEEEDRGVGWGGRGEEEEHIYEEVCLILKQKYNQA